MVLAEDINLSTLAISDEQGGNTVNNSGPVNSGEASFSTSNNTGSENHFTTGSSTTDASSENQFTTNPGSGGGGGGGGGGGSGGSSGGSRRKTPAKPVAPVIPALPTACTPYLKEYLRFGWTNNDRLEVIKLQAFLQIVEKLEVPINGVFDETTYEAVKIFQKRYAKDILTPWGISEPTGFVFITTRMAINNIYCQRSTATNLDLRGVYKNRGGQTSSALVSKPVENNLATTSTTTITRLIGPLPESPKLVAGVGLTNFWQDFGGWLNLLFAILAIIFFILWLYERNRRIDATRAPPSNESPPEDYDGPQLFSS